MKTMIGDFGPWAATLAKASGGLLRGPSDEVFAVRRERARQRFRERLAAPIRTHAPEITARVYHDGLEIETLTWRGVSGRNAEAWLLKPRGATGPLPGVLAMHDHGGFKFYGKEKIATTGPELRLGIGAHRLRYYEGLAWANELAKRGYVVLVPDAFAFGSRRVRLEDVPAELAAWAEPGAGEETAEGIAAYNRWTSAHETVMAKSLFCAGTTWPGVMVAEDRLALDALCARPEVDAARVGVGGLSGGGLRSVFLAGFDERVRCTVCAGMMTTWRDFLLNRSHTHTWMCYVPLLPSDLDFSDILALNTPAPALVQSPRGDPLFTPDEVTRAHAQLAEVYALAGAADRFSAVRPEGIHAFTRTMQAEAFAWFDRWLKRP